MPTSATADAGPTFERYRDQVYGWAYRVLGRHHDALDVAQDVFLRWLSQSRRGLPDHPRGWLRTATINRSIDLLRARRVTEAPDQLSDRPAATGVSTAQTEELRADIAAALATLTEAQRSVLIAKVYDGLTFAAIGAEHDLALSTVKTHYLRALAAVRDRLAKRWRAE